MTEVKHSLADVDIRLLSPYERKICGDDSMRSGDVALRLSGVFAVAGFIVIAAGIYEIDRREKSSSETVTANLIEIEQRVRALSEQARILNDQYAAQINTNERRIHSLRSTFINVAVVVPSIRLLSPSPL